MSYSNFFDQEFANLDLRDKRLGERATTIGNSLIRSPGSCIQEVFVTKNDARCAYDFFSNPKVNWLNLLDAHQDRTIERIDSSQDKYIYVIQDSTFYNYTNHKAKTDIGVIGKQGRFTQFGFLQHTALCVSAQDIPLGILELDFIGYEDDLKYVPYRKDFPEVASSRWRRFLSETMRKLQGTDKDIIMLCDREADFFELLDDLHNSRCKYVIRCKWDRPTGASARAKKDKFSSLLKKAPTLGKISLVTIDPNTHEETQKLFDLKAIENIMLPPVHRGVGHRQNSLAPIKLNVVEAFDLENKWLLLTNLPVKTLEDVSFVLQSYKRRWHIESLHKVLKTAYKAEQIYLHSSRDAIQNLLTIINIAACQTYWLIHQARKEEPRKATCYFSIQEINALNIYLFKKLPDAHQNLREIYYYIAVLGGYKNKNNKHPPGILTIYRGIKKLNNITEMYNALLSTKT